MKIPFTKMHGCGNDFVVIDATKELSSWQPTAKQASYLMDRNFGIGGDQLLVLFPSEVADARMAIYNADGSEVEMCGNGIRCCALFLKEHGIVPKAEQVIETLGGMIRPVVEDTRVRVDMGAPILEASQIPVVGQGQVVNAAAPQIAGEYKLPPMTCVSMGNPHTVFYVEDADAIALEEVGSQVEIAAVFPQKTNVEFVSVLADDKIRMRVWERGSGITLACGTGACASHVAGVLAGKIANKSKVILDGGELEIEWHGPGQSVWMTGPATEVFSGIITLED